MAHPRLTPGWSLVSEAALSEGRGLSQFVFQVRVHRTSSPFLGSRRHLSFRPCSGLLQRPGQPLTGALLLIPANISLRPWVTTRLATSLNIQGNQTQINSSENYPATHGRLTRGHANTQLQARLRLEPGQPAAYMRRISSVFSVQPEPTCCLRLWAPAWATHQVLPWLP